jgi:hypothetical protein
MARDVERERWLKQNAYAERGWGNLWSVELKDAPPWSSNEKAQLEWVRNYLAGWTLNFPDRLDEEKAVEEALRGKPAKLADLIRQPDAQLAQSTRDLVAEFLSGKRNLSTGRAKGKPGAPRRSEKQRREKARAHRATEIFLIIQDALSVIYPYKSDADICDRAMLLAEMQTGVEIKTIENHLKKPKSKRLPWRVYGHQEENSPRELVEDLKL